MSVTSWYPPTANLWTWYVANASTINPIVAGLGGAALVWAAVKQARTATNRHYEQTRADQQRRLTESFSKAVEQLADEKIEARLGGIYTLERLAIEAIAQVRPLPWWRRRFRRNRPQPADPVSGLYRTVMETLTAFVRERAKHRTEVTSPQSHLYPPATQPETTPATEELPPTDIAAVLTVFGRRSGAGREREKEQAWMPDLRGIDLRNTILAGVNLEGMDLSGAHLEGADLSEAHLEGANLSEAHLEGANLLQANLKRANLNKAHLERGFFTGTHLADATLIRAHLADAELIGTYLERADLRGADLRCAHLDGAHLECADLLQANLAGTDLRGAYLDGVQNLDRVYSSPQTRLPKGYPRPARWLPEAPEPPEIVAPAP